MAQDSLYRGFYRVDTSSITKMGTSYQELPDVTFWDNGEIEIHADTLQSLANLFKMYEKLEAKYWAGQAVLSNLNLPYLKKLLKDKYFTNAVNEYNKIEKIK